MRRRRLVTVAAVLLAGAGSALSQEPSGSPQTWSPKQAEAIIQKMLVKGRVPGSRGASLLNTSQAKSYKLRALWVTPEVIAASARMIQLQERLTEEQTRALVEEADLPGYTIILIDLDPDEGSGVIPPDWITFLQPKGVAADSGRAVRGLEKPGFSEKKALARVMRRDYAYDRLWVQFSLETDAGAALFSSSDQEAELIVQIRGREERVKWPIPDSIRAKLAAKTTAPN
jgi:hypothetical protein